MSRALRPCFQCPKFWSFISFFTNLVLPVNSLQNVTSWMAPRANLLGNSIYINGGNLFLENVPYSTSIDLKGSGALWELDLSSPHKMSQDLSILKSLPSPGQTDNKVFYVGGAMFANYDGLVTYGGMSSANDSFQNHGMFFYESSSSSGDLDGSKGTVDSPQPPIADDPSTWYRCCGADVSVPNENLAFYFSGLTASTSVPIVYSSNEGDIDQPNTPSRDFIMCNTTILDQLSCEGLPWPLGVEPRAESELIWLPYGAQGLLLSIGGIGIPSDLSVAGLTPTYDATNNTNNYMTSILVYDIDSGQWEAQQTDRSMPDSPSTLAAFCTVVATAQDNQSHHIHVYGGYDGTYSSDANAYDTVWVLSIPLFRWTKVSDGVPNHRRQNHKCVKTSPSQFFSIGGNLELGLDLMSPFIDVFDMNRLVWNSSYDPDYWSDYIVPMSIKQNVGDVNLIPNNLVPRVQEWLSKPYRGTLGMLGPHTKPSIVRYVKSKASWWLLTTVAVLAYLSLASCALIAVVILRRRMAYRSAQIDMSDMTSKSRMVRWMHNAPVKTADSIGQVELLKSPEQYTDSVTESYVDDQRSEHAAAPGQTKLSGTQVTVYKPLSVESVNDIELSSFTGSSQVRRL